MLPSKTAAFDLTSPGRSTNSTRALGAEGWSAYSFCQAPAISVISPGAGAPELDVALQRLRTARLALAALELGIEAAALRKGEAAADLASLNARIAVEKALFAQTAGDLAQLAKQAAQAERQAADRKTHASLLSKQQQLAAAELNNHPGRTKKITAATKELAEAQAHYDRVRLSQSVGETSYSPLSPIYPAQSTGRRRCDQPDHTNCTHFRFWV